MRVALAASRLGRGEMRTTRIRVAGAIALVVLAALAVAIANGRLGHAAMRASAQSAKARQEPELSPRLAKKIAAAAKAAPNAATVFDSEGSGEAGLDSFAAQDWAGHSQDGPDHGPPTSPAQAGADPPQAGRDTAPPPFSAFATARNDWFGLLGRPASGTGKW